MELQAQLIEERKQKAYIEMKIREEVCQEMAEQIVEIEKNYKLVFTKVSVYQNEFAKRSLKAGNVVEKDYQNVSETIFSNLPGASGIYNPGKNYCGSGRVY